MILHYDGFSWTKVASPTDDWLTSVFCLGSGNCWAVGADPQCTVGTICHYDGSAWSTHALLADVCYLESVYCTAADDCWAAGGYDKIYHYDGTSWTPWVVSGSNWLEVYWGISCLANNDCWAVGRLGRVAHYDGMSWTASRPTTDMLQDISWVGPNDWWAVGYSGVLRHYDGESWSGVTSPTSSWLHSVRCLASDGCWGVGENVFVRFDGETWSAQPSAGVLHNVYCLPGNDCWAVGDGGMILHHAPVERIFLPVLQRAPAPTATPTAIPLPTPSPTAGTPVAGCLPLTGAWLGSESQDGNQVSFTVVAPCTVRAFTMTVPFGLDECRISATVDLPVSDNKFTFSFLGGEIDGEFVSSSHATGSYDVFFCEDTAIMPSSQGTWLADRQMSQSR